MEAGDRREFPTIHMPKTVVILIGTNDLSYSDCHEDQQELLNAAPGIVNRQAPLQTYALWMQHMLSLLLSQHNLHRFVELPRGDVIGCMVSSCERNLYILSPKMQYNLAGGVCSTPCFIVPSV